MQQQQQKIDLETEIDDLLFTRDWTKHFLDIIDEAKIGTNGDSVDMAVVMRQCASMCYQRYRYDKIIDGFESLDDFSAFLNRDWNWRIVDYDRAKNALICEGTETECRCPVVKACKNEISPSICFCTNGLIKQVFEKALNTKVETSLISSRLRDGKNCVHRIEILDPDDTQAAYLFALQQNTSESFQR